MEIAYLATCAADSCVTDGIEALWNGISVPVHQNAGVVPRGLRKCGVSHLRIVASYTSKSYSFVMIVAGFCTG